VLNKAAQDVQAQLQAQGAALQQYTKAFLATRTAVLVRLFALFFFLLILAIFHGGAPAHPLGVAPEFRAGC
jgi:hypothetical protein